MSRRPADPGLSRRAFLRRAGSALSLPLALPLLQLPRAAYAESAPHPRRLVIFFSPNGTKRERWLPNGQKPPLGASPLTFGPLIAPLAPYRDNLLLVDGVDMPAAMTGPGGPHQRGMAALLSGAIIGEGDFQDGDGQRAGWGGGATIDQIAARALAPPTALSTLELGARVYENEPRARLSYRGRQQPVPPENDPVAAYRRMFGLVDVDPATMRRMLLRRRSVLDAVAGDFADLQRRVTPEDRVKLEVHAETLRQLEARLSRLAMPPPGCQVAMPPTGDLNVLGEAEFREILRAQIDLTVHALACDITRIASVQCSTAVNALRLTFLDLNDYDGHTLSHGVETSDRMQGLWERTLYWYAEQFAYLLSRLAVVPEGDGTLLDNTLVLWCSEISRGNTHSHQDMPFALAGGPKWLQTGQRVRFDGASHNDLLLTMLRAVGVEQATVGEAEFCNGGLSGLLRA